MSPPQNQVNTPTGALARKYFLPFGTTVNNRKSKSSKLQAFQNLSLQKLSLDKSKYLRRLKSL